ncbi:MAG: LysM peptidoglycan-binding domain-containing protein, partial [Bacteroidota bacterium]
KKLTADEVGMRVDRKVDERLNIIASSRGAAQYMQKNNFYFNNWLYALQAYQMGAGGAMDALGDVKGGEKRLTIDKKTYWYVKKYLAHKIAFEKAVEEAKANQPMLVVYTAGGGKSLKDIAAETNVELAELERFNTWLLTKRIPEDKKYEVIIPSTEASFTLASAKQTKVKAQSSTSSTTSLPPARKIALGEDAYRRITLNGLPGVIPNEEMTVDELAELMEVEPNNLINYNDLLPHNRIIVGQVYYIKSKRKKARIYYHTVQEGESVWMIAQNYGVKQSSLMKMNRIKEKDYSLELGRILWLRKTRPASVPIEYWPSSNSGDD